MSQTTATDVGQLPRSGDSTVANAHDVPQTTTYFQEEQHYNEETFIPENNGVTGREPNTNPPDWPTDQRRIPPHRPPVTHPQWVAIGGPLPMRIFLWDMFAGCQILQWGYSIARVMGLHDRGLCMYKVANEW